jgi:hypothetical protein
LAEDVDHRFARMGSEMPIAIPANTPYSPRRRAWKAGGKCP